MKEPYGEGLASHTDSESCAWNSRKAAREALTGAQAGRVLSRERREVQSPCLSVSPFAI
jgi:RNA-directed DNA polymerase